jgi:8-oxo-dGTP pyrophosphatase MutT (NUDIX family)
MKHGVGIILIRKDGSFLVQHRDDKPNIFYPDHWAYPAGLIEDNDKDYEAGAKRELEEETGYKAEQVYPLPEEEYLRPDGEKIRRHAFWALYDEKKAIRCNEGQEMKFIKLEDLKGKKLLPTQDKLFKLAVEESQKIIT